MHAVTKRELNQQTADVLAEVHAGEPVIVTERGVPRWRIELLDQTTDDVVTRLRREGRIRPALSDPAPWPDDQPALYTPTQVDEMFEESRGER